MIVICHGGAEKWDFPLPEYRKLYQQWIDQGVCAVIAHHPHVPQGWETYHGGVIFYSLGNFAFNKGRGIQDPETICVRLTVCAEEEPECVIVPTCFTEKGIQLHTADSFREHMHQCCSMLDDGYLERVGEKCLQVYKAQYRAYYESVLNIYTGSFKRFVKTVLYRYLRRQKYSDLWLYHNLEIETHYWICRRALLSVRKERNAEK